MNRRKYSGGRGSLGKGLMTFVLVMILAVAAGYVLTEYVITPYFLGTDREEPTGENPVEEGSNTSSILVDQQEIASEGETQSQAVSDPESPPQMEGEDSILREGAVFYCIQFGSFSQRAGAETLASNLESSGIPVAIIEKDGAYKLIGTPHITKEEAEKSMEMAKAAAGSDLFITKVEVRLQ